MLSRRTLLKSLAALVLPLGMSGITHAAPIDGVVRLVVGFPAGTSIDVIARRYASKLEGTYATNVIVENRPGAAGRIALDHVKRAQPDGRTFIIVPSPLMTLYPHVYKTLNYAPLTDFIPAGTVYDSSLGVAIGPAVPESVTTLPEFITWAQAQKQPVFFSANAQGAGPHFMGIKFAQTAKFEADFVPYQGGAPALQALLAGDLPMLSISMGTLAPYVKSENRNIRILASFDPKRNPLYPDIPTFSEQGYPDLVENEWGGIYLPAGTPADIVTQLESALRSATAQPDLVAGMNSQFLVVDFRGSQETAAVLAKGTEKHRDMVRASNFQQID